MAKSLDCEIEVTEFEPYSRNHVQFQTNKLEKAMKPHHFIHQAFG